jgi:hypothetical protein
LHAVAFSVAASCAVHFQIADNPSSQVGAGFSPHINQIESMRLQPLRDHLLVRGSFVINLTLPIVQGQALTADKPSSQVGAGFSPHINQIELMRLQPLRDHFLVRGNFVINLTLPLVQGQALLH